MVLVNVDDDSWTLGTDYGDESLASEYDDDFNKAMLMLKYSISTVRVASMCFLVS